MPCRFDIEGTHSRIHCGFDFRFGLEISRKTPSVITACYSAYVFDADRRANLLTSVESMGSKFGAEQQTPTDSRSSKCSARRPLRARSTSPDRANLRSAGTKPESTAPFRRRPCASRAASRPTGLDRAPFAPGRPEKGILAPRRPRLPRDWQTRVTAHHWPPRRPPCWKHRPPCPPVPPINSVRRRNPNLSGWCPIAFVTRTRSCFTAFSRTFAVAPCDSSRSSRLVINWTSFVQPAKPVAGTPKIPGFLRRMELIEGTAGARGQTLDRLG